MTITQSIILAAFAFLSGCVVTYIIKKANEYQRPMLPDREFSDPERIAPARCPECHTKMRYDDDRDTEGNLTSAPWFECENCGHKEGL